MQKTWHIITFFIICFVVGIGGGFVLGRYFPPKVIPSKDSNVLIQDTPIKDQTVPQIPIPVATNPIAIVPQSPEVDTSAVSKKKNITCPQPSDPQQLDLWLAPVGPDLDIGNYIPNHLVPLSDYVTTSKDGICLNQSAAVRLADMETAMRLEKLSIIVSSAYRSSNKQTSLHDTSEATRDPIKDPYPYVALPGHSEHQLGMTIDIVAKPDYTLAGFITTPEYTWLHDHAWEYGFIQSYPPGSEPITGYATESWHYRYVGIANAKNIHDQQITTYEYLKNLSSSPK